MLGRCLGALSVVLVIPVLGSFACNGGSSLDNTVFAEAGGGNRSGDGGTTSTRPTVVLGSLGQEGLYLVVTSSAVYVSAETTVFALPLAGGPAVTLASADESDIGGIAVVGGSLYWANPSTYEPDAGPNGGILTVPVTGGTSTTLVGGLTSPGPLAADSSAVYWLETTSCASALCPGSVMSAPVTASGEAGAPVVLATTVTFPIALAVDQANVYWGTSDGRVAMVPKAGGTATQLAFYETSIESLAVDDTSVYWSTSSGDLMKTPIGGGPSTTLLAGLNAVYGLAVGSSDVYFVTSDDQGNGLLQSIPLGGGSPTTLWSSSSDAPQVVQLGGTSLYFTTISGEVIAMSLL